MFWVVTGAPGEVGRGLAVGEEEQQLHGVAAAAGAVGGGEVAGEEVFEVVEGRVHLGHRHLPRLACPGFGLDWRLE
jgi:hypothetical protein